jgi:transcription factor CRZ1
MDNIRGRSPSRGNAQHISPQPSPSHFPGAVPGVDPSVQQALTQGKFNTANPFNNPFLGSQQQGGLQPDANQSNYFSNGQFQQNLYSESQFGAPSLDQSYNNGAFMYQGENLGNGFHPGYSMNQSFGMDPQNNINPAELSKVSSPQDQQSPSLQPPESQKQPSQPGSPASTNGQQFYTPQHSRNASLDPSSAWSGANFTQHRRAPSEHSDISSAQHSPYLAHAELHNAGVDLTHSPFLPAQPDTSNAFGMETFSLGDQVQAPYRSPRLMPHMEGGQPGPIMDGSGLHLNQSMGIPVPDVYTTQPPQYHVQAPVVPSNHMRNTSVVSDLGQADQFAPPTINIEPAPVSRQQSFGPQGEEMEGALSPPSSNSKAAGESSIHGMKLTPEQGAAIGANQM